VPLSNTKTQGVIPTFVEMLPEDTWTVRYRRGETVDAILQLFFANIQNAMLSFHSG